MAYNRPEYKILFRARKIGKCGFNKKFLLSRLSDKQRCGLWNKPGTCLSADSIVGHSGIIDLFWDKIFIADKKKRIPKSIPIRYNYRRSLGESYQQDSAGLCNRLHHLKAFPGIQYS
jgi:hypothetical protein